MKAEDKKSTELPLWTATYRLLEQVDFMLTTFTRDRRHTLGQRIYDTTLNMFADLQEASNFPEYREQALRHYLGQYAILQTLLKLSNEHHYMKQESYLALARPMASIERQANGWLRSTIDKPESVAQTIRESD